MPKDRALLDWLRVDRDAATSLQQQISGQMRNAILDGRLAPGTVLPSSRVLAADLLISRGTAIAVYDRLLGEGLLQGQERSAILVAAPKLQASTRTAANTTIATDAGDAASDMDELDRLPPRHAAFMPGVPALDIFPTKRWARLLSARAGQMSLDVAGEMVHFGGYLPLRRAIAEHVKSSRGVSCDREQVIITTSARAAFTTICGLIATPGDRCLVEDPGYPIARWIVASHGLQSIPIAVDAEGMRVDSTLPKAGLAYVTPTHQLPLGVQLSSVRCKALVDWAKSEDAWIVEDDYDSEFRYTGAAIVALHHWDPDGRVIHLGTFAKTLFPSLHVAYMIVPRELAKRAEKAVFLDGCEPTLHVQVALCDFIEQGHYATHIRRARSVYRRRQRQLVDALNHYLEGIVAISPPPGSMHIVVPLPSEIPAVQLQSVAAAAELHVRAISYYAARAAAPNAIQLGYAPLPDRQIEPAVRRLAGVVSSIRTGSVKER
jgi:GntR family transcriptional regulator / MocR family aminotransferase